ncbi:MAG: AsmA family protein [Burkholderiales bacterium]|nr:AsmA family protein [Burkholderiales bacterium]
MKLLKYALAGIAAAAAIAAIGVAVLIANFDANKFKADLAAAVKDRTQRTLAIEGAIKLAFFPKIGIELGRLSLSEPNAGAVFAAVNSARVSVELLPLLSKQIVVDRVAIDGLRANLISRKAGGSNFDDLMGGPGATGGKTNEAAAGLNLQIAGVDISNTELQWTDEANKRQFTIKNLQFKTGKLSAAKPAKFELALHLAAKHPELDVQISGSGSLSFDPPAGHYRLENLAVSASGTAAGLAISKLDVEGALDFKPDATSIDALLVKFSGKRGSDGIDATLGIPKARVAKGAIKADRISLVLKLARTDGGIEATLNVPGMQGSGSAFKSAGLTLDFAGKQGDNSFKGGLASPVSGNVEAGRYQLSRLAGNVNVTGPNLPKGAVSVTLTGNAAVDLPKKNAQLNLAAKFNQSSIDAKLDLKQFEPLALAFDLRVDQINLDQYLAPGNAKQAPGNAQQAKSAAATPIDLSALKAVNANGAINIGTLQVSGVKAADINTRVRLADGRLELNPHSARLYQGSTAGALTIDANGNRYSLKENLSGVNIGPLLKDLANKDMLEGRGNLALDLNSAGSSVGALKSALGGSARINLKDGALKGINLAETFRKAKAALGAKAATEQGAKAQEKTDFSELSASFAIKGGIAHNEDLSLKSPFLRVSGSGDINIGADTIDYLAKASVVSTAGGQGGKDLAELKGLTVPVRLSGPYEALKYRVDFGAMVGEVAKEKAKGAVTKAIGEKLGIGGTQQSGQGADLKDQARKALKGLFGR